MPQLRLSISSTNFLANVTNPTMEKPVDRASLLELVNERVKSTAPTTLTAGE